MSEPHGDGQPESGGQPNMSGQHGSGQPESGTGRPAGGNGQSQPKTNGYSGSGQPRRPGDPVADFQRWLMRAGARSMANQVADQVKRTLGQEKRYSGDVWDTATNEPPPNEPLECQWCPVCQAARAARMSGPGLGNFLADAGGALASVAQDFFAAFDQLMKTQGQNYSSERSGAAPPAPGPDRGDAAP